MKYKIKVYYDSKTEELYYDSLYDIYDSFNKYFDREYLKEIYYLDKDNSLHIESIINDFLWIFCDYYNNFSKAEIFNCEILLCALKKNQPLGEDNNYKFKFKYKNKIWLSNYSKNSIIQLYKNYCRIRDSYTIDKNENEVINDLFIQEFIKNHDLNEIDILDSNFNIVKRINNDNFKLNDSIVLKIIFKDNYYIYEDKLFFSLDELFNYYECFDTLKLLLNLYNKYSKKYNNIKKISIINSEDYSIIDEYDTWMINKGYFYRIMISYKNYKTYEGYYSCKMDFIEDLEGLIDRKNFEELMDLGDKLNFDDIISINKSIYKDAIDVDIVKIYNDKIIIVNKKTDI